MNALARTVFTPNERDRLERIPERDRLKAFFQAWTVKEAALKATGEGLRGLQRVETLVGVEDDEGGGSGRPVFGVNEIRDPKASSWTVHLLDPAPDFAAAVAVAESGFTPRTFDAKGILD
jgi:4'-phosphopantetheinyl transferase